MGKARPRRANTSPVGKRRRATTRYTQIPWVPGTAAATSRGAKKIPTPTMPLMPSASRLGRPRAGARGGGESLVRSLLRLALRLLVAGDRNVQADAALFVGLAANVLAEAGGDAGAVLVDASDVALRVGLARRLALLAGADREWAAGLGDALAVVQATGVDTRTGAARLKVRAVAVLQTVGQARVLRRARLIGGAVLVLEALHALGSAVAEEARRTAKGGIGARRLAQALVVCRAGVGVRIALAVHVVIRAVGGDST